MNTNPKWTFMVYLAGDNNLSTAGETDLGEMANVGSTDDVNIVAEFDRIGADHHTKRYFVEKDNLNEIEDLDETDSGDPNILLDFISWAKMNYPADRYAIILWNHGGGWEPAAIDKIATEVETRNYARSEGNERSASPLGRVFFRTTMKEIFKLETADERAICSDDGSGHSLDTIELGKVLAEANKLLEQKIDLLGMDACLMSNLEVAYQVRDFVKYIVASEENEPFDGWPYGAVLEKLVNNPDIQTADFASHIVKEYIDSYEPTNFTVTQAAMDISKVKELVNPLDELAQALIAKMPAAAYEVWTAQRKPAAKFWHNTLWDIAHFCERLEQGTEHDSVKLAAKSVQKALETRPDNFVVVESHRGEKVEHCGGVTIYLKPPPSEISRFYADLDFTTDHAWGQLLKEYHETE
jgi:hypothetical protein